MHVVPVSCEVGTVSEVSSSGRTTGIASTDAVRLARKAASLQQDLNFHPKLIIIFDENCRMIAHQRVDVS